MSTGARSNRRWTKPAGVAAGAAVAVLLIWLSVGRDDSRSSSASESPTATGRPSAAAAPAATASFTPGSLDPVPVGTAATVPPVPINQTAAFGTGLTLHVTGIEAVKGQAKSPGEIAGPALRVTLEATNATKQAISLATTVVEVSYGADKTPGVQLTEPGSKPFSGAVRPGGSATGTYVFTVPLDQRERIQVTMSYAASKPTVVLEGPAY
jgi:hypothetical protein